MHESPELRRGLWLTVVVSLGVTAVSLVTPVLIQKVFDNGFEPLDPRYVYRLCGAALLLVVIAFWAARTAGRRLVTAAENAMMGLRVRTFAHIHSLSIADQSEEKRGVFVARVTADVDALQQFMEWGGIAWIISITQVVGALGLMLYYAWQLALAIVLMMVPLLLIVIAMQAKLTVAFNTARTRVGEMLSEVSESVMGAAVVRAYGLDEHTDQKVKLAIDQRYRAEIVAHFRAATLWPLSSVFYAMALSVVVILGAFYGTGMGGDVRRDHRVPVPGRRVPARVHRPAGGLRGDPDGDRRLAQDPRRARAAGRDRGAGSTASSCLGRAVGRGARSARSPTGRARRCSTASRCRCRPAVTWPSSARPAAARRRSRS